MFVRTNKQAFYPDGVGKSRGPEFGKVIFEARQTKQWSLRKAAVETGVAYTRLDELEKGLNWHTGKAVRPTIEQVFRMADAYGLVAEHLLVLAGYEPLYRLTAMENKLLAAFRLLSAADQQLVVDDTVRRGQASP